MRIRFIIQVQSRGQRMVLLCLGRCGMFVAGDFWAFAIFFSPSRHAVGALHPGPGAESVVCLSTALRFQRAGRVPTQYLDQSGMGGALEAGNAVLVSPIRRFVELL